MCISFLMLQNSCQSSGFLDLFAFLYNRFFFLQVFTEPGKVVSGNCKTEWYILVHNVDDFFEERFHLSLTVIFWFREKYSCVKSSRDFWM